ncbi:MAG: toprim domain-containing protein [Filomicrobium sp.]
MRQEVDLYPQHAEWLEEKRKIPVEVAVANDVVTSRGNLAFEYRKNGALLYRKERYAKGSEKSFGRDRKGAESCLWGVDTLSDVSSEEAIVITEGEIDRLSVLAAGFGPCVSVPDGAVADEGTGMIDPLDDKKFSFLWDGELLIKPLRAATKIILATDNDHAGKAMRNELAVRIGRNRCWFVNYPGKTKDPNEVLVEFGPDALRQMLENAQPIIPGRLAPADAFDGQPIPLTREFGAGKIDQHFKYSPPSLCVFTGPPNAGKSQSSLFFTATAADTLNLRIAILQFEDHPGRLIRDLEKIRQSKGDCLDEASDWISRHYLFISPEVAEEVDFSIDWVKSTIEQAALREGCKIVVLDPWNEIEHLYDSRKGVAAYLNDKLRDLKRLARRLDIMLIIVAHPDKASGRLKAVADWDLYCLDGGAAWNNKADQGMVVIKNPDNEAERFFISCKSRDFDRWGRTGSVCVKFDQKSRTYKDVAY